ncbi:hypothetical protein E3T35_02145 [Cryobacterium sp. TMT1-2-2]|uniref:YdeI/OmpD-associated family protein n=1 Tax=Cryobacterium sp. TMT1-2-2 TaxID=1259233 RepID=UPI00106D51C1|nr:YdeI/OmpD-associated family protein [Cryobacterium sp. TMT1-2-2]TFD15189.1 hypothetical protein E3T35_02145 [Cryobacterium sp. TMT1-2-2]
MPRFTTNLLQNGNNVGIVIPDAVVAELGGGDAVEVTIVRDDEPREVEVPPPLALALAEDSDATAAWNRLSYSRRKEYARAIADAKGDDTRARRVGKTIADLRGVS